ncbi:MAG: ABC transporter permease subunit [Clostridia bacterium]|nr:ABC transporter permease subunit [Clostridia bacterium]
MLLFLYLPIIYLILFSFNRFHIDSNGDTIFKNLGKWNGFTLENYGSIFGRFKGLTWDNIESGRLFTSKAGNALILTLEIALISSIAATIIGTAAAIGINSMKKRARTTVLSVSQLPMVNPDLVTGITFMMLFAFANTLFGLEISDFLKLLIAHISFSIPYVIFSVLPRLKQSSDMLYEAALDLGCSPFKALIKAVIPDIMPGITSGFIMALTMSLDDFVVSYFTADSQVLSVFIYSNTQKGKIGVNPALATIIFIPLVAMLLAVNLRRLAKEREYEIQNKKVKLKK